MDFEDIYNTYYKEVYLFAVSLCKDSHKAEELTQDTFFRALKAYSSFRGDCKTSVWLCQIAKNLFFSEQKKKQRETRRQTELFREIREETEPEICTAADIKAILSAMKNPGREIFLLRAIGDLPFAKIAQLYGKSENWARVVYYRAKSNIIKELSADKT